MSVLKSADIHSLINWPDILATLGVPETYLRIKKPGPCLFCGGTDRWVFDNRRGRGDYFCRQCGPGSGFDLLMKFTGEDFAHVRRRVMHAASLVDPQAAAPPPMKPTPAIITPTPVAQPTRRVLDLLRSSCAVEDCEDARLYLESRGLWPLPAHCMLRAHASVEYWEDRVRVGRYPALLGSVRDVANGLVTAHVTYLENAGKLQGHESRKLLSPLTGREGCAVRLMPAETDVLGIAEGIETALSAAKLHGLSTWAALSAALLAKFEPPPQTRRLVIYADNDQPGVLAAARCLERLQGRLHVEIAVPPPAAKDWNAVLMEERE